MSTKAFNKRIPAKLVVNAVMALHDDLAAGDVTTKAILGGARSLGVQAFIKANDSGVLCGVPEALAVFKSQGVAARPLLKEGARFRQRTRVMALSGPAAGILASERTALDYLMVLSGIATQTRALVEKFGKGVAATRKTHPCMSLSEKRAVQVGGGISHRRSLSDAILVKDNYVHVLCKRRNLPYIDALRLGVKRAVRFKRLNRGVGFVEVEARNKSEAVTAAKAGADAVLLDNFSPPAVRETVKLLRSIDKKIVVEASGGITAENAGAYLAAGADFVSMGCLTLNSKPVDMSLELE